MFGRGRLPGRWFRRVVLWKNEGTPCAHARPNILDLSYAKYPKIVKNLEILSVLPFSFSFSRYSCTKLRFCDGWLLLLVAPLLYFDFRGAKESVGDGYGKGLVEALYANLGKDLKKFKVVL